MTSTAPEPVPPEYRPLASSADLRVVGLVGPARSGRLVVYAGAGISLGSGLPSGRTLSREIYTRLINMGVSLPGVDPFDLLAVADLVEAQPGGLLAIQSVASGAFPFTSAPPSAPHRALALLLLEGALHLLTTNWDTCIERAASPERISSVVTSAERLQIQSDSLLKVHGCADRQDTLLVTTGQLEAPPVWATTEIEAGLAQATVVFLGIGDVAPYVQRGLQRIVAELGPADHVMVVTPSIESKWDESNWAILLPHLPPEQRWGFYADEFSQGLLAAWMNDALNQVLSDSKSTAVPGLPSAFGKLHDTLRKHDADRVLSWLRRSRHRVQPGDGVAHDGRTGEGLLALALHTGSDGVGEVPGRGPVRSKSGPVDLLVAGDHTSGIALADEAISRATQYRQDGLLGPADEITVICTGAIGPLQATTVSVLPVDLVDDGDDGVVDGGSVRLISSHDILSETAA